MQGNYHPVIVFDFETTGLSSWKQKGYKISALLARGLEVIHWMSEEVAGPCQ